MYNLTEHRNHKIKSDFGTKDYYKYYKSIGGKLTYKQFSSVIRDFNKGLYGIICSSDYEYKFPNRIGVLTIIKVKNFISTTADGKLKTNLTPDWKTTMKLWDENPEARKNKIVIRHENRQSNRHLFKFIYRKTTANFRNKKIYAFSVNRGLKLFLKDLINANKFDASYTLRYE